ncbi:hypothetical protein [Piscirickettsia litoralis]|uniref:Uncharacterized protein n=1 Tax=Piscirickettsia litoralis TaxID=1891921 RepID=A0ABX3A4B9_9GAMM|nr:hypothetical protein [Piscirickettsia litoralis]ODN43293.1 hypothetical protein BGC07_10630 [Piscirickettsia litoralis]
MKTIIFLNRDSYNHYLYEFNRIEEVNDFRKVAIIGKDYKENLSNEQYSNFDKVYFVDVDEKK